MLSKKTSFVHLSQAMKNSFSELNVGKHLRDAGITKKLSFSCLAIFQLLFLLVFEHRNWYQAGLSKQAVDLPGKDAIYRFLKVPTFNWRKFLSSLSLESIQCFQKLTSSKRVSVFILDDSVYSRNRSKSVELLSLVHDHVTHKFIKGFSLLTLGWSDGYSLVPVDFALLSSAKQNNRFCEMDTWFTHAPLIESITDKGLYVIGMVKQMKQRYRYNDKLLKLEEVLN